MGRKESTFGDGKKMRGIGCVREKEKVGKSFKERRRTKLKVN